jgi:CheY-like chemotaxis protein
MSDILLIDDMKGVRRAVSSVLKGRGHVVTEADDGSKGMELLRGGRKFDLVITDILMPECDGTEVIMFLDTLPNRPRVLAISGGGNQVTSDVALLVARSKADAVLAKPFENADLIATVDRLLQKH